MKPRSFYTTGSSILWFLGQVIVLLICLWYIEFIYDQDIYPDKVVAETFGVADCSLLNKTLTTSGKVIHRYRADFQLVYFVNGKQYQSWTSGNGLDRSATTDLASQQDVLNQYNVGATYSCWYNPAVPQAVVLVQRHSWSSSFPLIIPSVIALIMIFYLLRSILIFFGFVTIKTREAIDEKHSRKRQ